MHRTAFLAAIALCVLAPASQAVAQSADDKAMAQTIGSQLKESGQLHDYRVGVKYHEGDGGTDGHGRQRTAAGHGAGSDAAHGRRRPASSII